MILECLLTVVGILCFMGVLVVAVSEWESRR